MGVPNFVKADIVKAALKKVANDNDTKTTVLGVVGGAVLASQIDWAKLFQHDPGQIGLLIGTIVATAFGYYTNKSGGVSGGDKQAPRQ